MNLCKKCSNKLSEHDNNFLCENCIEKRKAFKKKIFIGIGLIGATVVSALASSLVIDGDNDDEIIKNNNETQYSPLSAKSFLWIYDHWGEEEAQEISDKVTRGEMSAEHIETSIRRPDINPEDWRDFEEGWRPDDW